MSITIKNINSSLATTNYEVLTDTKELIQTILLNLQKITKLIKTEKWTQITRLIENIFKQCEKISREHYQKSKDFVIEMLTKEDLYITQHQKMNRLIK